MTQEEQIRLYRLMEKINWFSIKRCTTWIGKRRKRPHESVTRKFRDFTYDILWNDLPKRCRSSSWTRRNPCEYTDLLF